MRRLLSKVIVTSARPRLRRVVEPLKITSAISPPRRLLALCSPSTQRTASTSRRSLGMAEVTLTFDNSRQSLATEKEEVQITRRVYRDGQGEYLINQQLSRLKDIKEL